MFEENFKVDQGRPGESWLRQSGWRRIFHRR